MLGYKKYYNLYSKEDFTTNISNISNSCTYVDNTTLSNNQYTYLLGEQCLYLKKDNTKRGYIQFALDNVKNGDEIEISFEYFNLTSNKIEVSVTNGLSSPNILEKFDTTSEVGKWSLYTSKIIFDYNDVDLANINIGLWTHLLGEFKLRNIQIIHKAQIKPKTTQIKTYAIKKDTTGWIIRDDFSNSGGIIERYQDHLILHFSPSFEGVKRPIGSVGMDMYGSSKDYIVRISGTTTSQTNVYFYKVSDGTLISDPTTIATDVGVFLTFIVV